MRIVLDSNEFILGLDTTAGPSASSRLLDLVRILIDESEDFLLMVPEIIVREVQRNLPSDLEKDFFMLIQSSQKIELYKNLKATAFATLTAQDFLDLVEE